MAHHGGTRLTRRARGIGAFSGGLDGMLAASVLADQGVDLLLVTFSSPFFSERNGREGAARLGLPWRGIDFTPVIMSLLDAPPSGFGSCMNPCIDCHAAMIRALAEIMRDDGYDFVFTGEVLGQRPMSQSPPSLRRVANLSGAGDRLLRPLSAKLLEPTLPEREGLVDRAGLLGISGRGRKPQMALAAERGLEYPAPAGGCLLTDPIYSRRLGALKEAGLLTPRNACLIRHGRMLRAGPASFLVMGRDEADNTALEALSPGMAFAPRDVPGPSAVPVGDGVPEGLACSLVVLYTRHRGDGPVAVAIPGGGVLEAFPADPRAAEAMTVL